MPTCPITLLNVVNGVYYYQCVDCNSIHHSFVCSSTAPMQCGCNANNPDCTGTLNPDVVVPHNGVVFAVEGHLNLSTLAARGLAAALRADCPFEFANATPDPEYDGAGAYHVLPVDGRDRYVRVVRVTVKPPEGLALISSVNGETKVTPIPVLDLRVGQESALPDGVTPRRMEHAGKVRPGSLILMARRSGGPADAPAFQVVLAAD